MVASEPDPSAALLARLSAIAAEAGAATTSPNHNCVEGKVTSISAKWLLGGRQVVHAFRATLDPDSHEVRFRESATETSWGLSPPMFRVEVTSQHGARVSQTRTETNVGGGGRLTYGQFREEVEWAAKEAIWKFVLTMA